MSQWPVGTKRASLAKRQGPIKRIHVNKHVISANSKHGKNDPAITIQTSAGSLNCRAVAWSGMSIMRHDQESPLSCGAKVWIETYCALDIKL